MKLVEVLDRAEYAQQVKQALLAVQQFIADDTDHVDAELRHDPMYGFSLRAHAKLIVKKRGKPAGSMESVVLRFKRSDQVHDPVIATVDSAQVYYREYESADDRWNGDENLKRLAKEVVSVLNRRTLPDHGPSYRLGNLNALENKYSARWMKAPIYDGRHGVIIRALKSPNSVYLYVAKKSDNPNNGNYGYLAIYSTTKVIGHAKQFLALEDEMLVFVKQWVKENP